MIITTLLLPLGHIPFSILIYAVTCKAKILKKYFTKRNSTWTSGGVTYRRTNAPNFSRNVGLSKEIKKSR
jgi:hypothetical protein